MADSTTIQAAFTRNAQLLTARPAIGRKTDVTTVRVRDGLTCEIEDGPWTLSADLAPKCGGNGAGPTPGTFGRAALGSCLAMCYVMWAAALEVPLTHVEVEVQADADVGGMYGVDDTPVGYTEIRYEEVLDVACGTGLVTFRAAKQVGPAGTVVGTDIAEKMIQHAHLEALKQHLYQIWIHRKPPKLIMVSP